MKLKLIIIFFILFIFNSISIAVEYKEAPLPHYTKEKGYGWVTTVPVNKPEDKNSILKDWRSDNIREVFVDSGKDGSCDNVYVFITYGETNKKGDELFYFKGLKSCEFAENQIKNYLKTKEGQ